MGAVAVHARAVQPETNRHTLEQRLIEAYQPELNILSPPRMAGSQPFVRL